MLVFIDSSYYGSSGWISADLYRKLLTGLDDSVSQQDVTRMEIPTTKKSTALLYFV